MPFFSIILPTFNRAHLIIRAVESIKRQSFDDWGLIIIDDGSKDDTFAKLRDIVASDSRIRYHFSANRGLAGARNLGCSMASGKYLTFLDSDDEYLPDHLATRYEVLSQQPSIELLHGGVEVIGDRFVADKSDPSVKVDIADCVVGGTFFIRHDLWSRLGGFKDQYGDDGEFFANATEHGATIRKVDAKTYRYYRTESDSLCAIVDRDGIEGIVKFRAAG
jgi:glycosyltransferase involved in cell wall biosynthesis